MHNFECNILHQENNFIRAHIVMKTLYLKCLGRWFKGKECLGNNIGFVTVRRDLTTAPNDCAGGCNKRKDCFYANLNFGKSVAACFLQGKYCGLIERPDCSNCYMYQKG